MVEPLPRAEARKRAVEIIYEAKSRSQSIDSIVKSLVDSPDEFLLQLLDSYSKNESKSKDLIVEKSRGWDINRMPVLDVIIIQLAIGEMIDRLNPSPAIISQAVELASQYSTDDSSRFVNGILSSVENDLE